MDTFALEIRFRCLCFFVPEPATKRMHVLMPDTSAHACETMGSPPGCIDQHVVRILYPRAFGFTLDDKYQSVQDPSRVRFEELKMEEWSLVLGKGSGGAQLDLPQELVNITPNAGTVDPALLGSRRHPKVISRITLEGGQLVARRSGATWLFDGEEVDIIQELTWLIPNIEGDFLSWSRSRLKPAGEPPDPSDIQPLPDLLPTKGVIRLEVHHVMEADFPIPRPGDHKASSAHFAAYYNLFDYPHNTDRPLFLKEHETKPLTCMSSSGRLG